MHFGGTRSLRTSAHSVLGADRRGEDAKQGAFLSGRRFAGGIEESKKVAGFQAEERVFSPFSLAIVLSFVIRIPPMTKKDLIENVRSNSNLQRKEAEEIVDSFLDIMKDTLASGEEVKISGFGKFIVNQKHNRIGRNPQTGESLTITARKILTFKPSILLKQELNGE